jgi:hypothetical protein
MIAASLLCCAAVADSVLTYHAHADRSGNFIVPKLTWDRARSLRLDENFRTHVSGKIYAQPLYWRGLGTERAILLVATEDNVVYALDAMSGTEVWSRSLGTAIPLSTLDCGNISPVGITGTPVIDESSQAVYLDAGIYDSSGAHHRIFALALKDGTSLPGWPVDVADALKGGHPTFNSRTQNQRGALIVTCLSAAISAIAANTTVGLSAFHFAIPKQRRAGQRQHAVGESGPQQA